ncbi:YCF48-related protein [Algoriphagus litoralis]|uniref:YCF48-related protein n=1 Tax=Algoriphagus litoralis TaxID=2202829 RepID=UPI000DB92D88|nr:YCF48-related protein [Algoriphagus litoralis]
MKKLVLLFYLLFMITGAAWSQTWTRMQGWGLDLESIYWIDEQKGVAVGENLIIRTSDGGVTWEEVLQNFDTHFLDVVFLTETAGVAVGTNGAVFITSSGGENWEKKTSGTQNDLLSIAKISETEIISVGKNGEIIRSSNGGSVWSKISSGSSLDLNDIAMVGQDTLFLAGNDGVILSSFNKGLNWNSFTISPGIDIKGIAFSNSLIGYAVGEGGIFLKTIDGGGNWTTLNSTSTRTLNKVAVNPLDIRAVVAVGDSATIVRTANSGTTFAKANLGASNFRNIKNLNFKPNTALVSALGQDGYLINSTNSGASWTQKFAGVRNNFTSVDFKNQNTGFIAGESGAFFVTSNGATTLVSRPIPEPEFIQSIDFWNTAFGYASSPNGKIYRTGNTGSTWVPVFLPVSRTLSGFYLFAPSVLYAAGNNGFITRSFDSGVTWDQTILSSTTENLKDVTFFDFVTGFAIGENGQISWSAGGNVWENLPKVTRENLNALAKLDTTRAIIVGDGGIILKSEDKARNWKIVQSGTAKNLNSVDFFDSNVGFIAGDEGMALVTLDGGETWLESSTGTLRNFTGVSAGTDTKAYFVGADGSIITYNCIPPVGSLGEIAGNSQSCISNEIYAVSESPLAGSEIIWRVDGGEIISGQGTNQIEVKWTIPGRNAVLVSRSNFCGSGETSALEVAVSQIAPSTVLIAGDGLGCTAGSSSYSLPNLDGTTYTWTVTGGEIISGQGTSQIEITWSQSGNQLVSVTQENRCGKTEPIRKNVIINASPDQPSEISGANQIGLGEQYYEIVAVTGLDYRWTVSAGGKIVSGQGSNRILVDWESEGNFELSVEAQNECGFGTKRSLAVNVNVITALEPNKDFGLKIYPNPTSGNLTITSENLDLWTDLQIFNSLGQLIRDRKISPRESEINFDGLPKGILILQLRGKNGIMSQKVLVR